MHIARKKILTVFSLAPWPVREHGFSIRFYPLLCFLSERHDVDMVVLGDHRETGPPEDPLLERVRTFSKLLNLRPKPALIRRLPKIARFINPLGTPRAMVDYHEDSAFECLRERVEEQRYDVILWAGAGFRDVLARLQPLSGGARVVWDCVDSPYLLEKRRARGGGLLGRFEMWRMKRWEKAHAATADRVIYISQVDASACHQGKSPAIVIPNGVFSADFDDVTKDDGRTIGYLGHMSYGPNVQAALRLHRLFRKLKERGYEDARLKIIGRAPAPDILALAARDVEVTGEVSSIWPHVQEVGLFVFPLVSGAGLQNKILEAMYAGRAVVTSDICNLSLGGIDMQQLVVASSDDEIIDAMARLMDDGYLRARIAAAGQSFVRERYSLQEMLRQYEQVLCG